MSYYDDFDEEQRREFESDPMITGYDDGSGCIEPIMCLIIVIVVSILIANL